MYFVNAEGVPHAQYCIIVVLYRKLLNVCVDINRLLFIKYYGSVTIETGRRKI
jgi:hypothetical protein